ncbi:MAG: helix-turn-helix transcriptional regulator [Ectothiorhodospiraceae bacterium]|nr:helix-turn-helix transcriptional regulator [Ectothiorhodospiraceae bacterium]
MNIIGPQVKWLREQRDMTQNELVAHCNLVGLSISRSTLAKIESKVRRVTDSEVALLAKALKVDMSELYENHNDASKPN